MTRLKGLEKITEFLKVVFASGNIDEKPLSLILVAPVSSGKTTTIKQFQGNKSILITTDSTAWGILSKYQNKLVSNELKHIIIPDLHSALARRKTTADQLILFINNTSEDGLFPSMTYGMTINEFIKPFGWVLCLTTDGFNRKYKFLKEIGFISRFLVIKYKYSFEIIQDILKDIINENSKEPDIIKLKFKKKKVKIKGNKEIFEELVPYAKLMCKDSDSEILRMQKKLQTFLKSCAYLRKDNQVKKQDLIKLQGVIDLIS